MNTSVRYATPVAAAILLGALTGSACRKATARDGELLPGRSRPLLEHTWPHPRDLAFGANAFAPPDAAKALVTTSSGVRAYILPGDEPLVHVSAAVRLGRGTEAPGEAGAAELVSNLVSRTLRERLGAAFTGRVQVEQDMDLTRLSVQTLRDDWRAAVAAVVESLRQPILDALVVDTYRTGPGYAGQTRGLAGPAFRPAVELARRRSGYPLAPPDPGLTVSRGALSALLARALRPEAIVFGIGGGVTRQDAERALEELTSGWRVENATQDSSGSALAAGQSRLAADRLHAIDEPGFTTWIALGHPVPPLAPADEAAVAVMTEVLNIRLNIAVREIRGLANQAVLQLPASTRHGGLLHVRTGGRPESVAPLIHYSVQELSRIREAPGAPTDEELAQAKGGLILAQWQRALDGPRAASATYAAETARHGSLDRLNRWQEAVSGVTPDQVRAAAEKYIRPEQIGAVIVGQLEAVRTARHPRWPVALEDVLRAPVPSTTP